MVTLPQNTPSSAPSQETKSDYSIPSKIIRGWGDYQEYTQYSPSILIISDNPARLQQLEQWLESRFCQVNSVNINSDKLASVSRKYFDLMMIDLEAFEQASPQNHADILSLVQELKIYPELSSLPTVILTTCDQIRTLINQVINGPVYSLGQDASTEAILLQIVAQIHYSTYRYI